MQLNLGVIEKKTLGALLILADEKSLVEATQKEIADQMNYKSGGGGISFALKILERDNFIVRTGSHSYRILV